MSLVNDVLRDLDARQGGSSEVAGVSGVTVTAGGASRPSRRWWLLAVFVLAAVGLAMWLASTAPEPTSRVATTAVPAQPAPANPPAPESTPQSTGVGEPVPQADTPNLNAGSLGINSSLTLLPAKTGQPATDQTETTAGPRQKATPAATVLTSRVSFGAAPPRPAAPAPAEPAVVNEAVAESSPGPAAPVVAPVLSKPAASDAREQDARTLIAAGQYRAAIEVLSAPPVPEVAGNTRYFALLAAAQTSARQPEAAAQTYRALLGVDPRNGAWWLGYGAALEASQQPDAARDALQRALASRNLRPDLRRQAAMRLQRLNQTTDPTP